MDETVRKNKPFMTYEQQIMKLSTDKNLEIKDVAFATKILKEHSYFALISGYKAPFKAKDGNYKLHTLFEDIYNLYIFDDKIRNLFLQYILKIEKHVKSLISYSFCEVHGEEQQHYLNVTKYNYNSKNQDAINELVIRLKRITVDPKNYSYIKHQKNAHGNIPLWVIMKAITLGTVSKMYSFLPQSIQHNISKEFECVHESMLVQMLDLLARVRNVCAHNERLYDYKYKKGNIDDTEVHNKLQILKTKGKYVKGKNDLFAVVIVFKYLLDREIYLEFTNKLDSIIKTLLSETKIIQKMQLFKYMGFPNDWNLISEVNKIEKNNSYHFYKVKSVKVQSNLNILVEFINGKNKVYDVKELICKHEAFKALEDIPELFQQVVVAVGGYAIVWNDEIDISCNELWKNGKIVVAD